MKEAIISIAAAAVGFLAKSAWDLYWKQRQERQSLAYKKRVDFLDNQFSHFYWPVYIRLQKQCQPSTLRALSCCPLSLILTCTGLLIVTGTE